MVALVRQVGGAAIERRRINRQVFFTFHFGQEKSGPGFDPGFALPCQVAEHRFARPTRWSTRVSSPLNFRVLRSQIFATFEPTVNCVRQVGF